MTTSRAHFSVVLQGKKFLRRAPPAEWDWRVPVSSRTRKVAHLVPILDSVKRRYITRCGRSVNPGFCLVATSANPRCQRCLIANETAAPAE